MLSIRRTLTALAFGAAALATAPAHALLITSTANDFNLGWQVAVPASGATLQAYATFDVTSVTASQIVMTVNISNFSILGTLANAGLTSFALQTSPGVTSGTATGTIFDLVTIPPPPLPSLPNLNVCITGGNNCAGGGQGGLLAAGASESFVLTLNGNFANGLDILASGVKFQTSAGSFEQPGNFCTSPTDPDCFDPPGRVPEPGTLLLLSLGALAGFFSTRRRAA